MCEKSKVYLKISFKKKIVYNGDGDGETEMKTANNPTEAIELIKHYEEIIRIQHKRVIQYIHNIYNIQYTNKEKF